VKPREKFSVTVSEEVLMYGDRSMYLSMSSSCTAAQVIEVSATN
jgi:hypothetical protein